MAKGSQFERELSVLLSEWWTDGERSDIFWRSTTSGARATTRRKKGKRTAGSAGDLTAIDPIGYPFMELVLIEAKNGYSHDSVHDLFDVGATYGVQQFEKWYLQIKAAQEINGTPHWLLIWKRIRRNPTVWMSNTFFNELRAVGCQLHNTIPQIRMNLEMNAEEYPEAVGIFGTTLEIFLDEVVPQDILTLYADHFGHKPPHSR